HGPGSGAGPVLMGFVVVYDACVLYPSIKRDLLVRVAIAGTVRARWSAMIIEEVRRNLLADRPDIEPARLERTFDLMADALPDACITGFDDLIEGIHLPDADDRHVVAAAIRANAQVIVTENVRDFPSDYL